MGVTERHSIYQKNMKKTKTEEEEKKLKNEKKKTEEDDLKYEITLEYKFTDMEKKWTIELLHLAAEVRVCMYMYIYICTYIHISINMCRVIRYSC
jgi:hypothetical protein